MASAHVVHYVSERECLRSAVLRSAGFAVEELTSDLELARWFHFGGKTDLVCITEPVDRAAEAPLAIVRAFTPAPVVLFRSGNFNYLQRAWDLEVPPLVHPDAWLCSVAELLARTRANIAISAKLRGISRTLREESAYERRRSRALRQQLRRLLGR